MLQCAIDDTEIAVRHLPPLFDGLTPILLDDDTIAVYGLYTSGERTDQPLAVLDAPMWAFFATDLGVAIKQANQR